jgi:hypothetical protein
VELQIAALAGLARTEVVEPNHPRVVSLDDLLNLGAQVVR